MLCKEQQPVTQPYIAEVQTREASEETEGHVDLVEMTIQTDADMVTEEHTDLSEVATGQKGTAEMGQAEATTDKETPMDLGKSELDTRLQNMPVMCFCWINEIMQLVYVQDVLM